MICGPSCSFILLIISKNDYWLIWLRVCELLIKCYDYDILKKKLQYKRYLIGYKYQNLLHLSAAVIIIHELCCVKSNSRNFGMDVETKDKVKEKKYRLQLGSLMYFLWKCLMAIKNLERH